MNLLLTNDDGYDSPGLKALAERLAQDNSVYILAPDSNRSAVSHHFTMFRKNTFTKISENVYACSGYPADCTFAGAIGNLFDVKIDAVIAGINIGANMGTDIIYSGTCAAARQAVLIGLPGIAVSIDPVDWQKAEKEGFKFTAVADFLAKNLEKLIFLCSLEYPRAFVNINASSLDSYKGAKLANELCVRNYGDSIKFKKDGEKISESEIVMGQNHTEVLPETDFGISRSGYIAVSKVYADPMAERIVDGISFSM